MRGMEWVELIWVGLRWLGSFSLCCLSFRHCQSTATHQTHETLGPDWVGFPLFSPNPWDTGSPSSIVLLLLSLPDAEWHTHAHQTQGSHSVKTWFDFIWLDLIELIFFISLSHSLCSAPLAPITPGAERLTNSHQTSSPEMFLQLGPAQRTAHRARSLQLSSLPTHPWCRPLWLLCGFPG